MRKSVNVHAAKTHLSRLLDEAAAGEEIIIAKAGKPVARLVPVAKPQKRGGFGADKGRIWISPDFDVLPDDIARALGVDPGNEREARRRLERRAAERKARRRAR